MSNNGEIKDELEKEAILERIHATLSEQRRPESPLRSTATAHSGLLANYQKANKEEEILQELKQGIWENFQQADVICAALDELELMGLPFTPVLRRLAALNAGRDGMRMKELLKAYSHITIDNDEGKGISKPGLFSRFQKQKDPLQ